MSNQYDRKAVCLVKKALSESSALLSILSVSPMIEMQRLLLIAYTHHKAIPVFKKHHISLAHVHAVTTMFLSDAVYKMCDKSCYLPASAMQPIDYDECIECSIKTFFITNEKNAIESEIPTSEKITELQKI